MKLNKMAGLGIAFCVLFGSVVESSINIQPAQALEVKQGITGKAKLLNVNFRNRRRHSFKRNFRRNSRHQGRRSLRRSFKGSFPFKRHGRNHSGQNLKFDKAFSTGNHFDERIIRVRLF